MKKYSIYFILCCLLACFSACQNENESSNNETGYLQISIETATSTHTATRDVPANYNPKQMYVEIINRATGEVAKDINGNEMKTNDASTWSGQKFQLKVGYYTINASSYGFDGNDSGSNCARYAGSTQIAVQADKDVEAKVTCTLANVKVTVTFDEKLQTAFKSGTVVVSSAVEGINSQTFTMGSETKSVYFPVGDLTAKIALMNWGGDIYTMTKEFTDVQARDHYKLHYKLADSGDESFNITVDAEGNSYNWELQIPTTATTTLRASAANAWSTFAYLEGDVTSKAFSIDPTKMRFEYKEVDATVYTEIAAPSTATDHYELKLTGLTPGTTYVYRMVYSEGEEYPTSNEVTFTTEEETVLYNGGFENWAQGYVNSSYKYAWYPNSSDVYFWDTSNPGSTTLGESYNVTTKEESIVHGGTCAAKLASRNITFKFAAASIYTGSFSDLVGMSGAKLNWGREFTSRPTALHGYFQYAPGTIDNVNNPPTSAGIVKNETTDMCSIFIALMTKSYAVDNTDMSTFPDFNTDSGIVAYGELPISECISTNGEWKEFNIELRYNDLETKPTHILVVSSSSKYGDYFTGSSNSVLYLDDFELVYGDDPKVKE